jgi:hypothetical protein
MMNDELITHHLKFRVQTLYNALFTILHLQKQCKSSITINFDCLKNTVVTVLRQKQAKLQLCCNCRDDRVQV